MSLKLDLKNIAKANITRAGALPPSHTGDPFSGFRVHHPATLPQNVTVCVCTPKQGIAAAFWIQHYKKCPML